MDDDPSIADCDADRDGYRTSAAGGHDCDDRDAGIVPGTPFFADDDGDGYGAGAPIPGCGVPGAGYAAVDADCDDTDRDAHPGADETCDSVDRDCDGDPTAAAVDAGVAVYTDGDRDGYGSGTPNLVCVPVDGEATLGGDCVDADPLVFPGAPEVSGDGVDQDCDPANEFDTDGDGYEVDGGDCDDGDPDVHPGAPEVCDDADNDCDLLIDDEEADDDQALGEQLRYYADVDGDGHAGAVEQLFCPGADETQLGSGYLLVSDDCDDTDPAIAPGAPEMCNRADDDCNGLVDEAGSIGEFDAYADVDGDGWGIGAPVKTCFLDVGLALRDGDCIDGLADANPGAVEICGDAVRQDCLPLDPDDCDGDGFLANDPVAADCNDDPLGGGSAVSPIAIEVCDGVDNDCDARVDSDDPSVLVPPGGIEWYADKDGDGYGSAVRLPGNTCEPPAESAPNPDDCDDLRASVAPGAPEICDGLDNDCDGIAEDDDADLVGGLVFWSDADGDGAAGPSSSPVSACTAPSDVYVLRTDDCDDGDPTRSPLLPELCYNAEDDDCDGLVDGGDPDADLDSGATWYLDADKDGLGGDEAVRACADPSVANGETWVLSDGDCDDDDAGEGAADVWFVDSDVDGHAGTLDVEIGCRPDGEWYTFADDCQDTNPAILPGAQETCNFTDDDCNVVVDDGDPLDPINPPLYADADGDGWGDGNVFVAYGCFAGPNQSDQAGDCDDSDPSANPFALEIEGNLADDDCDGAVDEGDRDPGGGGGVPPVFVDCVGWQWPDMDGDKWGDRDATPTFGCALAIGFSATPADCNDDPVTGATDTPTVQLASTGADLTAQLTAGCVAIGLSSGFSDSGSWIFPSGSDITVYAMDPMSRPKLASAGINPVFTLSAPSTTVFLKDLVVLGPSPGELVLAKDSGSQLHLVQVLVDPAASGSGVKATGGILSLRDVTIANAAAVVDGSALRVEFGVQLQLDGVDVFDALGSPSSVYLHASAVNVARRLEAWRSNRVTITQGVAAGLVTLEDGRIIDAIDDGLFLDSKTPIDLERMVVAGSGSDGVFVDGSPGNGEVGLSHVTLVGNDGNGVELQGMGILNIDDSFVFGNGATDVVRYGGNASRSWIGTESGAFSTTTSPLPSKPSFVTFHPSLPADQYDLHLREGSEGIGTALGGDDAGAYSAFDPWYDDTDQDFLPDGWELGWFGDLTRDPTSTGDDSDIWDVGTEYAYATSPTLRDTDGDATDDAGDAAPLDPGFK